MARPIPLRAAASLIVVVLVGSTGWQLHPMAQAQGVVAPAPAGQPMWINQPQPVFQVGPNGAVNLDQPMPYTAAQVPPATYPPQPYATQPYVAQPGMPAIAPQPTWGAPFTPATNIAAPAPYFFLHRTSVFGEFLYMRLRDAEVAYALPVEVELFDVDPAGPVALVDPDYEPGFRVGGNWAVTEGNSIAAQYTRLRSESISAAVGSDEAPLFSLVSLPEALADDLLADSASALLNVELDQVDLDFRGLWAGCECNNYAFAVNYLGGIQYAVLDQSFRATFVEAADDPMEEDESTSVSSDVNFDGIGMRLGLQGERFFPASGVFVYGHGITTILFGEFDAAYRQVSFEDGAEDADGFTSWTAGRVVPVVELELGAGWLGVNRHLRLSAGYRVSAWFNVVTTDEWIWAVQNRDFRDMDDTLTFDGVVARAEWLF
jgi:hypothetical protein